MPFPVVPVALAGAAFLQWLNSRNATNTAADRQSAALDKAQGAITQGKDQALGLFKPYLENAGRDYGQLRGLVQSGFFQQPYQKSFQGQSFSPGNFSFDPKQASANFAPWKPQGGPAGFQAQALPSLPPMAQPPAQGGQNPPMVRRDPPQVYESIMEGPYRPGIADVMPQNLPGMVPQGQVPNPMEEVINRGKIPVDQSRNFMPPGPMTIQQLYSQGLLNRYGGSGTFIPTTYGRR
jgi:hypothetical protein